MKEAIKSYIPKRKGERKQFVEILFLELLLNGCKESSVIHNSFNEVLKINFQIYQLWKKSEYSKSIKLCTKSIYIAESFGFISQLAFPLSRKLLYYTWINYQPAKIKELKHKLKTNSNDLGNKFEIERIFFELHAKYIYKIDDLGSLDAAIIKLIRKNKYPPLSKIPQNLFAQYYFIALRYLSLKEEYYKAPIILQEAITLISQSPNKISESHKYIIIYYLTDYYYSIDSNGLSLGALHSFPLNLQKYSSNWFSFKLFKIQILIANKKLDAAIIEYNKITTNSPARFQLSSLNNWWRLTKIALKFLTSVFPYSESECKTYLKVPINVRKELNEINTNLTQEGKYKIPYYIYEILHLLDNKGYYSTSKKIVAFRRFCLRNNSLSKVSSREMTLSKNLLALRINHFEKQKINTAPRFPSKENVFKENNHRIGNFLHEIIPYEHLWEIILSLLPEKPYYE